MNFGFHHGLDTGLVGTLGGYLSNQWKKLENISKFNMNEIKEIPKNGRNLKITKRRLDTDKHQMFAVKDGDGNIMSDT